MRAALIVSMRTGVDLDRLLADPVLLREAVDVLEEMSGGAVPGVGDWAHGV